MLNSDTKRVSSYPFLSGDTFRDYADHIWDEDSEEFNPTFVKEREIVFTATHRIRDFFRLYHPQINNPYILVTHNSDLNIDKKVVKLMDNKVIHWFAQNVDCIHPRLSPVPIGLENMHHRKNGMIENFKEAQNNLPQSKENRILYSFRWQNNPLSRIPAYLVLKNINTASEIKGWPKPKEYLENLSQYKFVASPFGNGIDCIRTWEAMYLKTVPIVKNRLLNNYFKGLDLPILLINKWSDLRYLSEDELDNIYDKLSDKFNNSALYADFWMNKIKNI